MGSYAKKIDVNDVLNETIFKMEVFPKQIVSEWRQEGWILESAQGNLPLIIYAPREEFLSSLKRKKEEIVEYQSQFSDIEGDSHLNEIVKYLSENFKEGELITLWVQ